MTQFRISFQLGLQVCKIFQLSTFRPNRATADWFIPKIFQNDKNNLLPLHLGSFATLARLKNLALKWKLGLDLTLPRSDLIVFSSLSEIKKNPNPRVYSDSSYISKRGHRRWGSTTIRRPAAHLTPVSFSGNGDTELRPISSPVPFFLFLLLSSLAMSDRCWKPDLSLRSPSLVPTMQWQTNNWKTGASVPMNKKRKKWKLDLSSKWSIRWWPPSTTLIWQRPRTLLVLLTSGDQQI